MHAYLNLLADVLVKGHDKSDRTGVGTRSVFVRTFRHNLADGFPIPTTKRVHVRSMVGELLWMLRGDTNVGSLNAEGITIWDEWADEHGDLGPVYGRQWRAWSTADGRQIDQIARVVNSLKANPDSRRHYVSAWIVGDLEHMALSPCHNGSQFYVAPTSDGGPGLLSCHLSQRSADLFLGVPFNIASYALLTHIIAKECGLEVGEIVATFGDLHIYQNHVDQVREQLTRTPTALPTLEVADRPTPEGQSLPTYEISDFTLHGYHPQPGIKAPVAV